MRTRWYLRGMRDFIPFPIRATHLLDCRHAVNRYLTTIYYIHRLLLLFAICPSRDNLVELASPPWSAVEDYTIGPNIFPPSQFKKRFLRNVRVNFTFFATQKNTSRLQETALPATRRIFFLGVFADVKKNSGSVASMLAEWFFRRLYLFKPAGPACFFASQR